MSKEQIINKMEKIDSTVVGFRVKQNLLNEVDSIISEINEIEGKKTDRNKIIILAIENLVESYRK